MALVKFGGGITEMRGSIAGNVFSRNRGGAYVRARTTPINPNTARQIAVRSALAMLTVRWAQTLTVAQRTAWNLYAANVTMVNKLGESVNISGFNHYIRSNSFSAIRPTAFIDNGPTIFELPDADPTFSIAASEATQIITLTFDDTLAWASEDAAWFITYQGQPQNGQRNFFAGPWQHMFAAEGDNAAPQVSPLAPGVVQAIAAGQRQWVYARILRADGRLSEPFQADVLVGA